MDEKTKDLLLLQSVPGIGNQRIRQLVAHFGSPREALQASFAKLLQVDGVDKKLAGKILHDRELRFAEHQLKFAEKHRASILTFWNAHYPESLKRTFDPPVLLFQKGEWLPGDSISIAVVGTRSPSAYGTQVTEQLTRELVKTGFTIISGLARGIDTIAHRIALKTGGRTIAVLGSGLDLIYPAENKKLAEEIETSGAILTEYPLGSKPDAANFPKRNRIISGLALGTLVVEAGEKSGALITANYALEQGREVFAVPGATTSLRSVGTNRLIKEGAKLVQNVNDILQELDSKLRSLRRLETTSLTATPKNLSEDEKKVWDILTDEPQHIDTLSQRLGMASFQVVSLLLTLELKDAVKQLTGAYFIRAL
ncbi:hypothetical protein BMS3Abin05_01326 [bacterium BMS3Abin05]|nr:hypothetical protein BMS3Abin05_01326 [bacterium BMS3Abin05]GBE28517.1 hypothetical protein BMS3Bbin03_02456 [bacterium BMS3Bbin03]HDL78176.1 DNA-protecting protein DprA [Bacteroidota bacterium]HDZ12593.1 DNA-protecting protein DprA [Bacteroidota bacterium]